MGQRDIGLSRVWSALSFGFNYRTRRHPYALSAAIFILFCHGGWYVIEAYSSILIDD